MHIASCLNPKLIRHPFTHEQVYVPCGCCPACLRARSMRWVQRLEQERFSWKYCLFFTLTYDNQNLPRLQQISKFNGDNVDYYYVDVKHRLTPPNSDVTILNVNELIHKYSKDFSKDTDWLVRIGLNLPVLSSYDLQKFIKRYRTNLKRSYDRDRKKGLIFNEKYQPTFRYFCIGEYGETLLRPHYHGLFFFNSEYEASHASELVAKAWQYGITDSSFVSESNAQYVASYLNCTSHLPSVYRDLRTRPFFLCSKFPPIGTMCHSSKEIREIFLSATPEQVIFDHKRNIFDNVPLWRTLQDKLFPRLSAFSSLSHSDRIALYGFVKRENISNFAIFKSKVINSTSSLIQDYYNYIKVNCDNVDVALQRWFYISSRVARQAESFDVSLVDYVIQIEKYYDNVEKLKLKKQYEWQQSQMDENTRPLIGIDKLFLQSLLDLDVKNVSYEELIILSSYGVDVEKFFSDDENIRIQYQTSLLPESTYDYDVLRIDSENWLSRNTKTKKKNDYLALHPDYKNIIY